MKVYFFLVSFLTFATTFAAPPTISENIKIDQFGYRPNDPKIAVIAKPQTGVGSPSSYNPGTTFKVKRWSDDVEVFSSAITTWNSGNTHAQSGDKVWYFDFSTFGTAGDYYIFDPTNNVGSYKFSIGSNVYSNPIKTATKAFFYQRCGQNITATHGGTWTHAVCHQQTDQDLQCKPIGDKTNSALAKNLSGGWHDAGDYNKYVNFTYLPLHHLLFAYTDNSAAFTDDLGIPESGNGVPDVLDEIKYELDWLLKMQQANGSVLSKVSVDAFQGASPPNNDTAPRYYGPAGTSSTLTAASVFAHAYLIFKDIPTYSTYAATLKTKAIAAWDWAVANPSVYSSNSGFSSADPEVASYDIDARKTGASIMLYAATGGGSTYKTFFEANYSNLHPMQWTYFYPFESTYSDLLLFATTTSGISATVQSNIRNAFQNSTNNNPDFYTNVTGQTDAYRAYLKDNDYTWGSNQSKAWLGTMYGSMVRLGLSTANQANYKKAALDYLHFLHGVNALSYTMLSNTASIGADKPVLQIYHGWTGDGTSYDTNPIPGLVPGGYNNTYGGTNTYFSGQPVQKKYLDFNTSWPENSWEITEPAIYYQAMYVRLAATVLEGNIALPLTLTSFKVQKDNSNNVNIIWNTANESNIDYFDVEKSPNSTSFSAIGKISAKNGLVNSYQHDDNNVSDGVWYYRLKIVEKDGKTSYSPIESIIISKGTTSLQPNPSNGNFDIFTTNQEQPYYVCNSMGQIVAHGKIIPSSLDLSYLPEGVYYFVVNNQRVKILKR